MDNRTIKVDKDKYKNLTSWKHFEGLLKICLIIGIMIISGFIIYYVLTPEPGYVTLGILNEDKKAENYPTGATVNETISFYVNVGNYLNRNFSFQVQVKRGNKDTLMALNVPTNGSLDLIVGNFTLNDKEGWTSEQLNVFFLEQGENQIIIVELWQIKNAKENFYNKVYLRLNITS
ncbi:hypothetical protein LCGC14_0718840 [marine sediment metagenome]|uniref:DUF1616 domain-containing protein n=1 Tax=marine sediment metagenome TaxID=412755 RepID=A0A0F9QHB4_9ZZZZ|nr:MAG: hypothetical protein Lokiarch_33470 [Candidatus Lokiarchaeum sp. GC14_75]